MLDPVGIQIEDRHTIARKAERRERAPEPMDAISERPVRCVREDNAASCNRLRE